LMHAVKQRPATDGQMLLRVVVTGASSLTHTSCVFNTAALLQLFIAVPMKEHLSGILCCSKYP
jgi:hypothetical protein